MEHYARELLHSSEVSRKRARIHLWNRGQSKFYINNVCFRLVRLDIDARGYMIRREEKKLGVYLPDVICELPTREYETACNRLDKLFKGRDYLYIKTSRVRNEYHRANVRDKGYDKYLHYFLDAVLLERAYIIEAFDSLKELKHGVPNTISLV